ncbi:MAG TPA: MarR family transcriptional regulator [Candidatus Scatosoma pullicola]|nr:MarR family transcriptional regulator [Candidatus Scatosoma pullicola]
MLDEKSLVEKCAAMNRRLKRYFDSFFADSPITSIQGLVLDYLFRNRETDVFQKDLEEYLEIKGSSVTSILDNLEKNGYVRREAVDYDGRLKKLAITEKAYAIEEDIVERVNGYMYSLFRGISEEEREVFYSVLCKMIDNMQ